ncbi:acyltransferase domain-containing protein [Microlunatus ginsengisoli]|uniref:Malonyl-CoA:ACP transacylase (MAT) domain-containing protein n=1 Tax=Microlunatus ginsengisoli TaxID=363863 RepID=A0ABP7AGQ9_9ACTN
MASNRPVALLLPGQGAQYPRMAAGLYGDEPTFTAVMDQAFDLLGAELRADWLTSTPSEHFDDVTRAQPLLYAVGYGLGRLVLSWGIEPVALLGHSVGELVAATLCGVLTFEDGLRLMADRVEQYAATPPGGMLAVAASVEELTPFLGGGLAVAAVNAPRQTLVAGTAEELAELRRSLSEAGITSLPTRAKQGFHSPVVAGAAAGTLGAWRTTSLAPATRRIYSSHLASVLGEKLATDPEFWAWQPTMTVLFWPSLDLLLRQEREVLLLEVGPGQGLTAIARRHPAVAHGASDARALLPARHSTDQADRDSVADVRAWLAADGHVLRPGAVAA